MAGFKREALDRQIIDTVYRRQYNKSIFCGRPVVHIHHIVPYYDCIQAGIDPNELTNLWAVNKSDHAASHWGLYMRFRKHVDLEITRAWLLRCPVEELRLFLEVTARGSEALDMMEVCNSDWMNPKKAFKWLHRIGV